MKTNMDYSKSPLILGIPWITFEAIDYLKELIKPEMKVFEFGSGGSTKFFVTRVKEIHSVEHDELWYNLVEKEIGGFQNLNLSLIKGEDKPITTAGIISDEDNDLLDYWKYSNSISDFEDQYFDLILIDGKARNACIKNSIPKLKNGGYLVVDNSHRKSYSYTISSISNWQLFRSFGPSVNSKRFTQTSFFQKAEHGI
ncbi:class I SAM-dependent methyltransferase [Cyclobacterium roseum]|uniref:class I SAM-dependent methyltransferase n=1 Tax=Cyclobacterium roseum TaxID=2666137 RepID=UPI0013919161|nr:class I SAM-dependent methyltransferase [Cyclobacterium roseum]